MAKWIQVWSGRDGNKYEELKVLLNAAKIKYHARGINVTHPAGAGIAGAGTQSRSGYINNGASFVSSMQDQAYRYEIEIKEKDFPVWREINSSHDAK